MTTPFLVAEVPYGVGGHVILLPSGSLEERKIAENCLVRVPRTARVSGEGYIAVSREALQRISGRAGRECLALVNVDTQRLEQQKIERWIEKLALLADSLSETCPELEEASERDTILVSPTLRRWGKELSLDQLATEQSESASSQLAFRFVFFIVSVFGIGTVLFLLYRSAAGRNTPHDSVIGSPQPSVSRPSPTEPSSTNPVPPARTRIQVLKDRADKLKRRIHTEQSVSRMLDSISEIESLCKDSEDADFSKVLVQQYGDAVFERLRKELGEQPTIKRISANLPSKVADRLDMLRRLYSRAEDGKLEWEIKVASLFQPAFDKQRADAAAKIERLLRCESKEAATDLIHNDYKLLSHVPDFAQRTTLYSKVFKEMQEADDRVGRALNGNITLQISLQYEIKDIKQLVLYYRHDSNRELVDLAFRQEDTYCCKLPVIRFLTERLRLEIIRKRLHGTDHEITRGQIRDLIEPHGETIIKEQHELPVTSVVLKVVDRKGIDDLMGLLKQLQISVKLPE